MPEAYSDDSENETETQESAVPVRMKSICKLFRKLINFIRRYLRLQTGIFTPASDIWSFGRIIADMALAPLMTEMEWSRSHISPKYADLYFEFEPIVLEMTMLDATRRPTAKTALKRTFHLLIKFENDVDLKRPVYRRMTRLFSNPELTN